MISLRDMSSVPYKKDNDNLLIFDGRWQLSQHFINLSISCELCDDFPNFPHSPKHQWGLFFAWRKWPSLESLALRLKLLLDCFEILPESSDNLLLSNTSSGLELTFDFWSTHRKNQQKSTSQRAFYLSKPRASHFWPGQKYWSTD